jgi:DNA repair protein RadC
MADNNKHLHSGHRQRLQALLANEGLDAFTDYQVLEMLLFYGIPRKDTNDIAHKLMDHFESLSAVMEADSGAIAKAGGITVYAASLLSMAPSLARRYMRDRWKDKPCLDSTAKAGEFAVSLFVGLRHESFHAICLDAQCRVRKSALVCEGTINEAPVYPRSIIEAVLKHNALSVILAHNHPGGTPKPSKADIDVTFRLKEALSAVGVKLVDHIIVAGCNYYSLAEQGTLC